MAASSSAAKGSRHGNGIWGRLLPHVVEVESRRCLSPGRPHGRLLVCRNRPEPDGAVLRARIYREHWPGVGVSRVKTSGRGHKAKIVMLSYGAFDRSGTLRI